MSLDNTSSLNDIVTTLNNVTGISSKQSLIDLANEAAASNEYYANQLYNSLVALGITPSSKTWADLKAGIDQISTYDNNLYNAIVSKGSTPTSKEFNDLITAIGNITIESLGGRRYKTITVVPTVTNPTISGQSVANVSLDFTPSIIIIPSLSDNYNTTCSYYYNNMWNTLFAGTMKCIIYVDAANNIINFKYDRNGGSSDYPIHTFTAICYE